MSETICMFCNHLDFDNDVGGDYAEGASLSCKKNHFDRNSIYDLDDFRAAIVRAKDCPDYDEAKRET